MYLQTTSAGLILEKVQAANRSSLTSCKDRSGTSTSSNELQGKEKKLLISDGKGLQNRSSIITDSPGISILDEESFKALLTPCLSKKRKVVGTKHGEMRHEENFKDHSYRLRNCESNDISSSPNSLECESRRDSDSGSVRRAQVGAPQLSEDSTTSNNNKKTDGKVVGQKDNVPSGNEETRGSDFLIQVRCFSIVYHIFTLS